MWALRLLELLGRKFVLAGPDGFVWMERWCPLWFPSVRGWWGFLPTVTIHRLHNRTGAEVAHNHGCRTVSYLVSGGYDEWIDGATRRNKAGDFVVTPNGSFHKLVNVLPETFTIFYWGWRFRTTEFLVQGKPGAALEVFGGRDVRVKWQRATPEVMKDLERRRAKARALKVKRQLAAAPQE